MRGKRSGQGMAEYTLILAGVALLAVVAILIFTNHAAYQEPDQYGVQRIEYPDYTCFRGRYPSEFSCVKK